MTNRKTSEVLDLAADVVQQRGWTGRQQANADPYGHLDPWGLDGTSPVCIEGALIAVYGTEKIPTTYEVSRCPAYKALHEYLGLWTGERLFNWNDAPERTKEEVIATLRGAAAVERANEEALQVVGV